MQKRIKIKKEVKEENVEKDKDKEEVKEDNVEKDEDKEVVNKENVEKDKDKEEVKEENVEKDKDKEEVKEENVEKDKDKDVDKEDEDEDEKESSDSDKTDQIYYLLILTDTIWEVVETIGTLATVTTAIVDTAFTLTVVYITEIILGSCHLTFTSCEMNKSFVKQHHHFSCSFHEPDS